VTVHAYLFEAQATCSVARVIEKAGINPVNASAYIRVVIYILHRNITATMLSRIITSVRIAAPG